MSDKEWTEDQKKVIDINAQDILVSAAAGSGKTATMVERVIEKVRHGISIDRFLVVTFTRAAAAEMKERIGNALYKALDSSEDPDFIEEQLQIVNSAQITTIDSFCQYVVKNYFYTIDLDPDFRVADDDEVKILLRSTLKDFIEDETEIALNEEKDSSFIKVMDMVSGWKSTAEMETLVEKMYRQAETKPYPEEWLKKTSEVYAEASDEGTFAGSSFCRDIKKYIGNGLDRALGCEREALSRALSADILSEVYKDFLTEEITRIENVLNKADSGDLDTVIGELDGLKRLKRFPAGKRKAIEEAGLGSVKEEIKALRDAAKTIIKDITDTVNAGDSGDGTDTCSESIMGCFRYIKPFIDELTDITLRFMKKFEAAKQDAGIIDFGDMEHLALRILTRRDPETGDPVPSDTAVLLRSHYSEIMVDEYQDSNFVQEAILSCVAGNESDPPHMFMVGDVKQSIYGFRSARPDLFTDKYERFTNVRNVPYEKISSFSDKNKNALIVLRENFRSRRSVLDITNELFRRIMHRTAGDVEYDEEAELVCGSPLYCDSEDEYDYVPELLIVEDRERKQKKNIPENRVSEDEKHEDGLPRLSPSEIGAQLIANRINEMVNSSRPLYVKDGNGKRKVRYSDIAILMRSLSASGTDYVNVLRENGIPAYSSTETGYFSANEIVVTLNYLRIIDNPLQDIPLASVLRSSYGNFSDQDLAGLSIMSREKNALTLYDALCAAEEENSKKIPHTTVSEKAAAFMQHYRKFEDDSKILSVYDLLNEIYDYTGFYDLAAATQDGEKCRADLDLLLQKAYEFSSTGGRSIFSFVHFIEELKEEKIDYGEGKLINENTDAVAVMTIHKSKGLEFPVVFIANLGKRFSDRDYRGRAVVDTDRGLCMNITVPEKNITSKWIYKKYISDTIKKRQCAEEMRLLYVAMTRAKEKLIFADIADTIDENDIEKTFDKIDKKYSKYSTAMSTGMPEAADGSAMRDWIYPLFTMKDNNGMRPLIDAVNRFKEELGSGSEEICASAEGMKMKVQILSYARCLKEAAEYMAVSDTDTILNSAFSPESNGAHGQSETEPAADAEDIAVIKLHRMQKNFTYDFAVEEDIPDKVSVSELKDALTGAEDLFDDMADAPMYSDINENAQPEGCIEKSPGSRRKVRANERGTAYHCVMEHFPFENTENYTGDPEKIRSFIDSLSGRFITKEQAESVDENDIMNFLKSGIAGKMKDACSEDMLFREQPFMKRYSSSDLFNVKDTGHTTIVQGTIDAFFENSDGTYTVVDYKTDALKGKPAEEFEEILRKRYENQLLFYADAVASLTGRKVSRRIIYSFSLGKAIEI